MLITWPYKRAKKEHITFFNFCLFRLPHCSVVRRPLSSLAVVVHPLYVVALSATCSPHVVGYRPLAQQHRRRHSHCVLILPLPSLVVHRAVHRPLLPQPTAVVDRSLWSPRFFVRHLLYFLSTREQMDKQTTKMECDRSRHTIASRRTRQFNRCWRLSTRSSPCRHCVNPCHTSSSPRSTPSYNNIVAQPQSVLRAINPLLPPKKAYLLAWDAVLFDPMRRHSRLDLVWGFGRAFPPAAMVEFTKYNIEVRTANRQPIYWFHCMWDCLDRAQFRQFFGERGV